MSTLSQSIPLCDAPCPVCASRSRCPLFPWARASVRFLEYETRIRDLAISMSVAGTIGTREMARRIQQIAKKVHEGEGADRIARGATTGSSANDPEPLPAGLPHLDSRCLKNLKISLEQFSRNGYIPR